MTNRIETIYLSDGDIATMNIPTDEVTIYGEPSFPQLATICSHGLYYEFSKQEGVRGTPEFPRLVRIETSGMRGTFWDCPYVKGDVEFPKLTLVGDRGMYQTFLECHGKRVATSTKPDPGISSCSFPLLQKVGNFGMFQCFAECDDLETVTFPRLEQLGREAMSMCFMYCGKLKRVDFPALLRRDLGNPSITTSTYVQTVSENVSTQTDGDFLITTIETTYRYRTDGGKFNIQKETNRYTIGDLCFHNAFRGCKKLEVHFPEALEPAFIDVWTKEHLGLYDTESKVVFDL